MVASIPTNMRTIPTHQLGSRRGALTLAAGLAATAILVAAAVQLPLPVFTGLLYFVGLAGAGILALRFKRLERQTAASAQQLADVKRAIDHAAIVATTDVTGRITYVNDKFCEISKYYMEELVGQDHRILNSGYHTREFFENLWSTIARGDLWRGEIKNQAQDGSTYWVETTIVPFMDEAGKPDQYFAICNDISRYKEAD